MIVHKPATWLELNKEAFEHNVQLYKKIVGHDTALSVVVKSNAYGHGIAEIGLLCQASTAVDWLCTTSLSEALLLRAHHVTKPILLLSIIDEDPAKAILYDIDVALFDVETAHILNAAAAALGKHVAVHVKIDTGVSRFGFYPEQALCVIEQIKKLSHVTIRGLFTHCAESGNTDQTFTMQQLEQFDALCTELEQANIHIPFRHAGNSAAAATNRLFPRFNFVRVGAGAYGLWHFKDGIESHPELDLKPVLTWKARITHLRQIPANTPVGYDRTYITAQPTTVATLPLGYFEGYDRRLSNKGVVYLNGYYAPVIGRVCMNAILIAIPSDKQAALGDEVILLGDYDHIRAHEIANTIGSFNAREVTTRLNPSMPRDVVDEKASACYVQVFHKDVESTQKVGNTYKG